MNQPQFDIDGVDRLARGRMGYMDHYSGAATWDEFGFRGNQIERLFDHGHTSGRDEDEDDGDE